MRFDDLQASMRDGATLLTPTQRSARLWRERLLRADPTMRPAVLPWGAWTEALWQSAIIRGEDDRVLLNSTQNADVWAHLLHQASPGTLRPISSLVDLCVQAQYLLHSYGAARNMLAANSSGSSDVRQFADWFRSFAQLCEQQRVLPAPALEDALSSLPNLAVSAPLLLLGFDDLAPTRRHLLETLQSRGTVVSHVDPAEAARVQSAPATLLSCDDEHSEWAALARTLRHDLSSGDQSIVVVLPDAEACRPSLERALREVFGTQAHSGTQPWEFSDGQPLKALPLAADAFGLLRWSAAPVAATTAGSLLRSPYLDLGISFEDAAELEVAVLRAPGQIRTEWSLRTLADRCGGIAGRTLQSAALAAQTFNTPRLPGSWAQAIQQVLQAAGWPGKRELSSTEYQALDRWQDLMDSVASLDFFERPMHFVEFLELLDEAAAKMRFAPENRGAAIQILSPEEAAGVTADLLWLAHADETRWSGRQSVSPLLPWALQAEYGMPGTDPLQDGAAHRSLTERLLRSASKTIVSFAASNDAGAVLPAAAFRSLQVMRHTHETATIEPIKGPVLEEINDNIGPALTADSVVQGGVAVLKNQAACAFRAYAEERLYATQPESDDLGYDARERGTFLHSVLEEFWKRTKTQTELLRLRKTGELSTALEADVLAVLPHKPLDDWSAAYLQLQRRRLHSIALQWLHFEAERPDFEVSGTERRVEAELGPLRFRVRVDRIDSVVDNGEPALVLIDYKTGVSSPGGWLGERPDEPQLPLYAVTAGLDHVQAIAFATVKAGDKMRLQSFPPASPLIAKGKPEKPPDRFDVQMEKWRETLLRLSQEFAAGEANVNPKDYPRTCAHCNQRMLCRLNPATLVDTSDETQGEDA